MSFVALRTSTSACELRSSPNVFRKSCGSFFSAAFRKDFSSSANLRRPFTTASLSFSMSFGAVTLSRSAAASWSWASAALSSFVSSVIELGAVVSGFRPFEIAWLSEVRCCSYSDLESCPPPPPPPHPEATKASATAARVAAPRCLASARLRENALNLLWVMPAEGAYLIDEKTPSWGIEPVPERLRVLGLVDTMLLWSNLSVSLLVIVLGAVLVPALSLPDALIAIVVGAIAGNLLLGLAGLIGADARVPGMVVLRAPLGRRGSYAPTLVNVAQNLGWSTFELIVISTAAAALSRKVFGFEGRWLWALLFRLVAVALALLGPIGFVRRYVRKFAVWAVVASMIYLTWWVLDKSNLHAFWRAHGTGGLSLGSGIDLVIGSIISWTPLAADYTRFSRDRRSAFFGTGIGYFVPTLWCFGLGTLLVLSRNVTDAADVPAAVAAGGAVSAFALLALTVDESDEAFADIYSTAVSIQNVLPRVSQRLLIIAVSAAATVGAIAIDLRSYQSFLFLLGSVFVPLFGVLLADWLLAGAHYRERDFFSGPAVRVEQIAAWLVGFALYQWLSPQGPGWWTDLVAHSHPGHTSWTASLPSFAAAFVLATAAGLLLPREDANRARRGSREPLARPR